MSTFNFNSPNEVRRVTRSNIASLFAALMHLNSLVTVTYSQRLLAFLGAVYNRILVLFDANARSLISELKLVRRWFLEFIRNGNTDNPGLEWDRWDDSNNCPVLLEGLDALWDEIESPSDSHYTDHAAQLIFTLLSIDRIIVVPAVPNYSTIEDGPVIEPVGYPTNEELVNALSSLHIDPAAFKAFYNQQVHDFDYEVLSTRGPNGDATWTAHLDARAWALDTELFRRFSAWLEESRLTRILRDLFGCIRSAAAEAIPNLSPILGKLSVIEEWGGKARIVAQMDYWTQMALTPLHNTINHFLRALKEDGTFNQHAIAERVRQWTADPSMEVFSFDLTAATDRVPITFQESILSYLMTSKSFGNGWASILVDREFLTPNGDLISYNTGQPMGARSSFPMLALTHHIIVQIAAARAGLTVYRDYVVLGDDVTLTNAQVAAHYQTIMRCLGVPINLSKSIVHVDGGVSMAEICKRVFMDGVEISRFNPKLIVNVIRDGRLGPDLQNDLIIRGWDPSNEVFWKFMAGLLSIDNLTLLIRLNCAPISITGLLRQFASNSKLAQLSAWIPAYQDLKPEHLVELFTYVTASEALKRLDGILRAAVTINDSLSIIAAANAHPDRIPQYVRDTWLGEGLTKEERARLEGLIASTGPITPNHPLVSASRAEANRISELLHQLNSHDTAIITRARLGLLDVFRTSISSIWLDDGNIRAGESRSIFTRMLTTLVSLFTSEKRVSKSGRNLSLSYSVVLTSLSRLWTVALDFGGQVTVNALRANVTRDIHNAVDNLKAAEEAAVLISSSSVPTTSPTPATPKGIRRRRAFARIS
ncbi:RNA-directed RNA polymerase [Rhizophagus sp. RF1 mitovirus]|uniref:RNA-directed RNA polymerase n=1 Tax=Rhizophagus sp. RF1 mitovirus TaxID=758866 RepID=E2RWR3_9VIRU|nr:RNA-directed RNA polymerase [Rhizophagus sp. RF1 mitovirus]BAJ23143.2 RNA-directed RNA polymerase [Rhizophagus sp. RF1 mitovirus]